MNQISHLKYSKLFLNGLSLLTMVTLLLAIFSQLPAHPAEMVMYFCSDTLYLPSVYRDLMIDQSDISGWHFNPAPNFFPDMGFYFLLMFFFNNLIVSSFVFSFVQCLFLCFILVKLLKLIFPAAKPIYTLLIYILLGVFLLEFFFFSKNFMDVFFLLINSYHTGGFIMSLVCTFFSFKFIIGKRPVWLVLICVTGFLCVISDRLFLVLFVAPMVISCLLLGKRIEWRTAIPLIITIVIFAWVGVKVFKEIDTYPYDMLPSVKPAATSVILQQAEHYFVQIGNYMTDFGFMALTIYLFIISFFLMAFVFLKSIRDTTQKMIPFYALYSLVFSTVVILAPILSGKYEGSDCLRYNVYPFYLAILNFAVFFMFRSTQKRSNEKWSWVLIGLNLVFLLIAFTQLRPGGLYDFFNYYPEKAMLLDVMAEKAGLKRGVANYWDAKEMTMFSKKGVEVRAVFDDVSLHNHVANDHWYFGNDFDFIIWTKFNDTTLFRKRLKDVRVISDSPKFRLIKTHPFTYIKSIGGSPVNLNDQTKENAPNEAH